MSFLKEEGLADRTIYNHIMRIGTLLKSHGIVGLLGAADKPKYDEREVEAYAPDQLTALFAAADSEELELFQFFLGTGLREQEVMYTSWKNIDFQGKVVKVRSKPEMGFRIKDKEERSVPVPDTQAERIRKATHLPSGPELLAPKAAIGNSAQRLDRRQIAGLWIPVSSASGLSVLARPCDCPNDFASRFFG